MAGGLLAQCCGCRPTNQFCCGCSLPFGAKLILLCNLLMNVFYIATATANIILKVPTVGFGADMTHQTFNAGFCLFGLPFIVAAIYGVIHRQEAHVRLYLYYLVLSFVLDMFYVFYYMVIEDSCSMMPNAFKKHGSAFACGMMRTFTLAFIFLVTIIQTYCIYTIWSMAEDIKAGGAGSGFPELLENASKAPSSTSVEGIFGTNSGSSDFQRPLNYGSLTSAGVGGGNKIFGGSKHDVNYPPRGI